ncbi:MAG: DUF3592 domain-containing protein [Deltaproteobacteria bacterium]|nr:DUF3592 domain-containing protein [Deltaproteobacteria bacterium]
MRGPQGPAPTTWVDPPPVPRQTGLLALRHLDVSAFFFIVFGTLFGGLGGGLGLLFLAIGLYAGPLMMAAIGGFFFLIFGGIGGGFGFYGASRMRRLAAIVREGEVVAGRIERVEVDRSVRQNGRSPVVVHYSFTWRGATIDGNTTCWKMSLLRAPPGAPLAVLVDQSDPQRNLAWLPAR